MEKEYMAAIPKRLAQDFFYNPFTKQKPVNFLVENEDEKNS